MPNWSQNYPTTQLKLDTMDIEFVDLLARGSHLKTERLQRFQGRTIFFPAFTLHLLFSGERTSAEYALFSIG